MFNIKDKKIYLQNFNQISEIFPSKIKNLLLNLSDEIKVNAQEIRVNKTIRIISENKIIPINIFIYKKDIDEIFKYICNYSIYSFQEQLKNGFITFNGGHRIGIGCSAVIQNNEIYNIKNITSFNIRISKEVIGCSDNLYHLIKNDNLGTLILGPPCSGKTTLIRDLARNISEFKKVTIIDERFEISGFYNGEIQNNIGQSDVLAGFPKDIGILRAIRCLSPDTIICDEIGSLNEVKSITQCLNSGVKIIATIHAKDEFELINKPQIKTILKYGAFEKIVILNPNKLGEVLKIIEVGDLSLDKNNRNNFNCHFRNPNRIYNIT